MRRLLPLVFLLSACTAVGGDPVPGHPISRQPAATQPSAPTSEVTAQADVAFRPVEEVLTTGQAEPPDVLADADGVVYRLGPAIGDMTRFGDVRAEESEHGGWVVTVTLTAQDAMEFGDWTTSHVGQQLAIVVDGDVVSAPTIEGPITGGTVQISGAFTRAEAAELADAITGG